MTPAVGGGWDDVYTARAYERFCRRHRRYRVANEALVAHAALAPGLRVLDVAAGTGRTAEAVLPHLRASGIVISVEPSRAMREAGKRRLGDPRITWAANLPDDGAATFDRVVCGAAIWQLLPLDSMLARLVALIAPGGALVFNIPAQYLLEPDRAGGGRDPLLLELPGLVERSMPSSDHGDRVRGDGSSQLPRSAGEMDRLLAATCLRAERWSFELRLTQAAYRDWLRIPPVSEGMLAGLTPAERERRLDAAYERADQRSWRWERWMGWTAWRVS